MSIRNQILEAMRLDLNEMRNDSTAPIIIKRVEMFDRRTIDLADYKKPIVMITDGFEEEEIHTDGTNDVVLWRINIYGIVEAKNGLDLLDANNRLVALLKQYIKTEPTLPQVYSIKYRSASTNYPTEYDYGECSVIADVLYYTESGVY